MFQRLFPAKRKINCIPSVRDGERIYAIGDIHGRSDLLDHLLAKIADDNSSRGAIIPYLIFLGDLIDRGPDSKSVVEKVLRLKAHNPHVIVIKGNHEEVLLATLKGDRSAAALFNRMGGKETLMSYGVTSDDYDKASLDEVSELTRHCIPKKHVDFLEALESFHNSGDYLFVHAGVRPGLSIEEQRDSDLRWIRRDFLTYQKDFGKMVVHGHNVTDIPDEKSNRIGIDTGAYLTGRLTALGLEGNKRWYLSTR